MRKLSIYIAKYGPETGPTLFRALQSQAAHAGVGARLRRKIETLKAFPGDSHGSPASGDTPPVREFPLFPELSRSDLSSS